MVLEGAGDGAALPTPSDGFGMLSILPTKTSAGPHTSQQAPRRCLSCRNGPGRVRVIWLDTRVLTRVPTGPIHPSPAHPTLQRLLITCSSGAERVASALGKPWASAGQPGGSPVPSTAGAVDVPAGVRNATAAGRFQGAHTGPRSEGI